MYGLCLVIGILSGGFIEKKYCDSQNKDFLDWIVIATLSISFGFIFAKLFFIFITYPKKDFFTCIFKMLFSKNNQDELFNSGFVFYGGLFGGILGYFIGTKIAKCTFFEFCDLFAVIIPYVHFWGRLGCFFAGCCYGITLENGNIFPVQLLEAVFLLGLFFFLKNMLEKGKKYLIFLYLILYGIIRFNTEFLRGDFIRGFVGVFSISQWISIFSILLGIVGLKFVKLKIDNK